MTTAKPFHMRGADRPDEPDQQWTDLMFGPDPAATTTEKPSRQTPPLLARIPDVSEELPGRPQNVFVARGPEAVRVDPPAPRVPTTRHSEADRARLCDVAVTLRPSPTPSARRFKPRPLPKRLDVLPSGNPFEFPREGLPDRFAPAVRFLLLFVLFTAAGTSVLMMGQSKEMPPDRLNRPMATLEGAVGVPTAAEPASRNRPTLESLVPAESATTATSPSASTSLIEATPAPARTEAKLIPENERPATDLASDWPSKMPNSQRNSDETFSRSPYPTTNFEPVRMPTAADGPLPQVRTIDAPAAVAARPDLDRLRSPR